MDREKLAPPVLSKKRSILRSKPNVMEVAPEVEDDIKSYTTDSNSVRNLGQRMDLSISIPVARKTHKFASSLAFDP